MNNSSLLFYYLLRLADDRLILGHRLSEWCGHAHILEEDIALANIALDCIGQANNLYSVSAELEENRRTADELVYFRESVDFKNLLLVEQPNKDFAYTIVRQFLYDSYGVLLFDLLRQSSYEPLSGIAQKAVKELRYHFRHSSSWVVRLGDGTTESHHRIQSAVDNLWKYTDEMFISDETERRLHDDGLVPLSASFQTGWLNTVSILLTTATIQLPSADKYQHSGGREGRHSEHLGHLLAEMQIIPRSFPEIKW